MAKFFDEMLEEAREARRVIAAQKALPPDQRDEEALQQAYSVLFGQNMVYGMLLALFGVGMYVVGSLWEPFQAFLLEVFYEATW